MSQMESAEHQVRPGHAAFYRVTVTALAVALTTIIGGGAVVAIYYPLRHAQFAFQWLLVFLMMTGESMAIHLLSEVILPVAGWSIVRDHHRGRPGPHSCGPDRLSVRNRTIGRNRNRGGRFPPLS